MKKLLIFLIGVALSIGVNAQIVRAYSMLMPPPGPFISTVGTLSNFLTATGSASAEQTFTFTGSSLTASVVWTAGTVTEVSKDGISWFSSITYTQSGGNANGTVHVRVTAAASNGSYSSNISGASTGATTVNVPYSATVTSSPSMSINPTTITNLNSTTGSAGSPQTFIVTFANIGGNVTVNNFSPVELSQDGTNYFSSISFSSGSPKTVYVRNSASSPVGGVSGNLAVSAPGVSSQNVSVSGTISSTSSTPDSARFQFDTSAANDVAGWTIVRGDPSLHVIAGTIGGTTINYTTGSTNSANWGQFSGACIGINNGVTNASIPDLSNKGVMREAVINANIFGTTNAQFITGGWKTDGTLYDIEMSGTTQYSVSAVGLYNVRGAGLQTTRAITGQSNTNVTASWASVAPDLSGNFTFYFGKNSGSEQLSLLSYIKIKKH